jgi:EAL domain-containing protein (putative c-di-GMP-specific phosphodiesterase class I)
VEERFQKPWKINIGEVRMGLRSGLMTEEVVSKCPMQLRELLYFYFSEDFNENKSHIVLNEELLERMQRARNVEKALDRAIKNDSIQVWYQPIYSYKNKCFDTAEALVRLEDEELGRIMPGEFIERAEKTGQIILLGRQIFRKVCAFISDNDLKSMGINYIHVNLSPIQCMNEMLVKEFSSDMKLYNTKPSMIEFEITETATIETEEFQTNLRQLAHIGKGLALDDYGSGATNLNRMVQWHINMVKIDKNIVSSFFEKGDITVITDLVNMFHNQNLLVVAEGIETKEMTEMAEAAKVDLAQGYYYSKPLPEHEYIQFLKDHTV